MQPFIDNSRALLKISGNNIISFLQRIISADINKLKDTKAIYSLVLSEKGKFLFDIFIIRQNNFLLIDCDKMQLDAFVSHLRNFDLKKQLKISDLSNNFKTCVHLKKDSINDIVHYEDPRSIKLGIRSITKDIAISNIQPELYKLIHIIECIPSSKDLIFNESFPIEYGLQNIGSSMSFDKGCYIGQEIGVLMKRKERKQKLCTIISSQKKLNEKEKIFNSQNKNIGYIKSSAMGLALAWVNIPHETPHHTENNIKISILP